LIVLAESDAGLRNENTQSQSCDRMQEFRERGTKVSRARKTATNNRQNANGARQALIACRSCAATLSTPACRELIAQLAVRTTARVNKK
jgi:hypothetical protein